MHKRVLTMLLGALLVLGGCASQPAPEKDMDKAIAELNKAYAELGKVENDLDENNSKRAAKHFNAAIHDVDNSFVYLAKASVPPEDEQAVTALKEAFAELENCLKALEVGDYDRAQRYYDYAQAHFAEASVLLD